MSSTVLPVMIIVIESGAIYSAALVSGLAAYAAGNNALYIIKDFVRSGITLRLSSFMLIIN
jgi:hypothetical protein